ncbi:MAG TPA: ion transporter [Prosthecobacter sp.]
MSITRDENGRAHFGRLEGFLQLLILVNLIAFSLETLPGLSPAWQNGLWVVETISVLTFTVEYIVRVACSCPRSGYAWSFMGVIDLVSILPYYLGTAFDLRSMRAFRLMRVFRIFKLARYSAAMRRYHLAFQYAKEELVLFGAAALIVLYLAAVGIYYFENEEQPTVYASVFHSLWWAIVTLTTVGYGDAIPHTLGGRVFTGFVLIAGLGIVAVPTGLLAAALSKAREHERELEKAEKRLRDSQAGPQ